MGSSSLLKGELELNGRRIVVMPQVEKTDVAKVISQNQEDRLAANKDDKRNLYLKKEGILNERNWFNQKPALTSKELENRQRLFIEKDKALKHSPNLSVAPLRI